MRCWTAKACRAASEAATRLCGWDGGLTDVLERLGGGCPGALGLLEAEGVEGGADGDVHVAGERVVRGCDAVGVALGELEVGGGVGDGGDAGVGGGVLALGADGHGFASMLVCQGGGGRILCLGEARGAFEKEGNSRLGYRFLCACYHAGCAATPHPKKVACSRASFSAAFTLEKPVRGFMWVFLAQPLPHLPFCEPARPPPAATTPPFP